MSRLTVGSLEGLSENSNVISVPTGHTLQLGGENITPYAGRRNLLYNGAMQVAQRGTSSTGWTGGGFKTADRWEINMTTFGTWTQTIENDGPSGYGFSKSIKNLCTSSYSPSAGNEMQFRQKLEGQDLQGIAKGSVGAKQLTLSFWVKSNVTGTYIVELEDQDNGRNVSASYTVNSSGTWEHKVMTLPADTTGAFDSDNSASLAVIWWQGAGTNFTSGTLATSWVSPTSANRAVGQVNLASAVNNYWQVTGLQLELGNKATPFEHRSYGEELALCQRYYEKTYSDNVTPGSVVNQGSVYNASASNAFSDMCYNVEFSVSKRVPPTMTFYQVGGTQGTWNYQRSGVSSTSTPVWSGTWAGTHGGLLYQPVGAAYTAAFHYGHWVAEAEL